MPIPTLPDPVIFYRVVWEIVRQIPHGQVATYGQIASMIPTPDEVDPDEYAAFGAVLVGYAMNAVSSVDEPTVPWHRVVNSKGGIAMSDTNPASALQRGRLRAEGVDFNHKELIDLNTYGWEPDPAWVESQGLLPPRPIKKPKPAPKTAKAKKSDTSEENDDDDPDALPANAKSSRPLKPQDDDDDIDPQTGQLRMF